VNTSVINRP